MWVCSSSSSSKGCTWQERERRIKRQWSWRYTIKGWWRQSCATSGKRPARVHTVTTASSLTASLSYVLSSGTHVTRPSFAGWSLPATPVPTATGATSATLSPTKRGPSCSPHLHVDRYYNIFQLYTTTYLYNTSPSSEWWLKLHYAVLGLYIFFIFSYFSSN